MMREIRRMRVRTLGACVATLLAAAALLRAAWLGDYVWALCAAVIGAADWTLCAWYAKTHNAMLREYTRRNGR